MIKLVQVPPATASATAATYVIEFDESLCKSYCVNAAIQPSAVVSFSVGTVTNNETVAIIPITATVAVTTAINSCGCAHTQIFTENFDLAMTATTANTVTLTPTNVVSVKPRNIKCCQAKGVTVTTVFDLGIA